MNNEFGRPGVSDSFLATAGCHHVGENDCASLYGFKSAGIAIPFRDRRGEAIMDAEKPFARVRLYRETDTQKYSQRSGSGVHVFIPPGFKQRAKGSTVILIEGEFKALSLDEAGFCALGLCGLNGAVRTVERNDGRGHELHDELAELLAEHQPATVVFAGDADVVINSHFAAEAAKLRKLMFGSRRFAFVERLVVVKPPFDGPKGFDDVRAAQGGNFNTSFDGLLATGFEIEAKMTRVEIFCEFLRREQAAVKSLLTNETGQTHRLRVKLLNSAAYFWHDAAATLSLSPLLAECLSLKESKLARLIKDAGHPVAQDIPHPKPAKGSVTFRNVEPWEHSVNGVALLNEIEAFYEKFVVLPSGAGCVLAVWCLQTWCYELFDFAAIVAVWSPEEACGKGRVLDVTEKLVRRPFRTSNSSAAVMYHVISKGNLTMLVDELDSINDEQRAAICNILKGGFQSNGTAHRMTERNGEQVEIEFSTFCPKMIATITLDKLDKATRSRTIGIRMQRKARSQKVAKFRRVDATTLQRKCMRWAQDNAEALKAVPPMDVDECATDRQEDVWEPLVAIARVAGGDRENLVRLAAKQLASGGSDGASETVAHQLLASFRSFFDEHGDRADTKTIIAALNDSGDFADLNRGRGLTPRFIAYLLKPYGIEPRVHKMADGKTARGYSHEDCEKAFAAYLSEPSPGSPASKCKTVTTIENIEQNAVNENVTVENGYTSESAVSTNKDAGGYGVTVQTSNKDEIIL